MNALQHGRFLTVRTLTENDGESHDSIAVDLDDVLKKVGQRGFHKSLHFLSRLSWIWTFRR